MFNLADLIVVAIIGITAFAGYKGGFVKTGLGFLSFFIAVVVTFMFYKPMMQIIRDNTGFEPWLTEYLSSLDTKQLSTKASQNEKEDAEEETSYINNLPDSVVELIGIKEMKEQAKSVIIEKVVQFSLKLLAIVIVYIVTRLALIVIIMVLDLIAKLPVLKQFNEILGLALGFLLGLIKTYGLFAVITFLGSINLTTGIIELINNSLIASFLYNNNILLKLIF